MYNFIEAYFTYIIYPQVYKSKNFRKFTKMCNYHHKSVWEHFHHHKMIPRVHYLLILFLDTFSAQKFCILVLSNLSIFSFMVYAFCVSFWTKSFPASQSPLFSSESLNFLLLNIEVNRFSLELIFMYDVVIFHIGHQLSLHHLFQVPSFIQRYALLSLS